MQILYNHIGYEPQSKKTAIVQTTDESSLAATIDLRLVDTETGRTVFTPELKSSGTVEGWRNRYFYEYDFSDFNVHGSYRLEAFCGELQLISQPFKIQDRLLVDTCISDILFYFKSQRSSGKWDQADRNAPFFGDRSDRVDVHGGWFDAAGDYSKYLSHLSYANYFNPQQIPLVSWALFEVCETLADSSEDRDTLLPERALEEAFWGADYLMRSQDPAGYFYTTVFDKWSKKTEERIISSFRTQQGERLAGYQAGFRQGGGLAVAALARAASISKYPETRGEYRADQYLKTAISAYEHLKEHNLEYLDNGRENIIDYYCALLAAIELFKTTGEELYLQDSRKRAGQLSELFSDEYAYMRVEMESDRPFFHASDAGLPLLALLRYYHSERSIEAKEAAAETLLKYAGSILASTRRVYNPFGLARKWVQPVGGEIGESFFIPHVNETGYWWQGENAALASLSCGFRLAVQILDGRSESNTVLKSADMWSFSDAQISWILGLNPFDICMLQGRGRNNPEYEEFYPNAPGGICNGITAGFSDEDDIDFLPEAIRHRGDHKWRWSEQWIPHPAWFLLALTADSRTWSEP